MGGILALISNALSVVGGWLGLQNKKLDLKNAADVKQAQARQDEVNAVDKTAEAVAKQDLKEIRNEIAE